MRITREHMKTKYKDTLKAMREHGEDGDSDVLFDKLVHMARRHAGERFSEETDYYVPEGFDYGAFMWDYREFTL